MLVIAITFVACALSAPNLGRVIYIGNFRFGTEQKRICYAIYVIVMVVLFMVSLFVKKDKKER